MQGTARQGEGMSKSKPRIPDRRDYMECTKKNSEVAMQHEGNVTNESKTRDCKTQNAEASLQPSGAGTAAA
jgi:hypothetical protein